MKEYRHQENKPTYYIQDNKSRRIEMNPAPAQAYAPVRRSPRRKRRGVAVLAACVLVATAAFIGFKAGSAKSGVVKDASPAPAEPAIYETAAAAAVPEPAEPAAETLSAGSLSVSDIVEKTLDSIVEINVQVSEYNPYYGNITGEAAGSGVIISKDGYIATNHHVVENGVSYTVRLSNGEEYDAQLIGSDSSVDIGLLKIDAEALNPTAMGDSDTLRTGDAVIAIGNPLGTLGGTVTNGIISAVDRECDLGNGTMHLIQTNAALSPGNSGGGLFNESGELIGIVVAKSVTENSEGIGFAIPINTAKATLDELKQNGGSLKSQSKIPQKSQTDGSLQNAAPYTLGVTITELSQKEAASYGFSSAGVYVVSVEQGSPAEMLGIQSGDRIVSLAGFEIMNAEDIKAILSECTAGDTIEITIDRMGTYATGDITFGAQNGIYRS